jgi:hypothetical protein
MAELGSLGGGKPGAMFGGGVLGLRGGMKSPVFLLTASLLNDGGSSISPPSRSALASSSVQAAFQTLQTDLKNDVPSESRPTHASVGQLQDDLSAIRKGTLSGTAAQTQIQSDEAAILSSMGLSSNQVAQIQSDLAAVQSAIQSASSPSSSSATASTTTTAGAPAPGGSASGSAGSSAAQSALQTVQADIQNDVTKGNWPTHASVGQLMDDIDSIRKGTLTGTQATTTIQADAAAVWTSMGLTQAQVTQIQSDQQAVQAAVQANSSPSSNASGTTASSSGSDVSAVLSSVGAYLVGIPGLSAVGMRGAGGFGMRGHGDFGIGGPGGFGMASHRWR